MTDSRTWANVRLVTKVGDQTEQKRSPPSRGNPVFFDPAVLTSGFALWKFGSQTAQETVDFGANLLLP